MMNPRELDVVLAFVQQHPEAAARELELQAQETTAELIEALPLHQGRQLVTHMLPPYAARLCAYLSLDTAAGLLSEFNANQAAAILRGMPKSNRDDLLKVLPEKTTILCRLLLSYSDDSVGAWMSADIVMLPSNCSVAEALQRFTSTNSSIIGDGLPVVDNDRNLTGLVCLRDLLRAKGESSISHLRQDAPSTLSSRTSLAAAAHHDGWQQHDILPVLNRNKQLVGLLRHVDLRRSLEQFGEISRVIPQDDFLGSMGEAYLGTLTALLGLVNKQSEPSSMLGER
ncbi:MAG: CBS domain-containing protein [Porticoccus sp.]|nr:CBS domain-containing protein [Porticoccus sp.]